MKTKPSRILPFFNILWASLVVILLILLLVFSVRKFHPNEAAEQAATDDTVSMMEDDSESADEPTLKTSPDEDGLGTEVMM